MKTRIDIDTHVFVRFWLVIVGLALVALALYSARIALLILGISLFLAFALNIPVSKIARRLPGKSRVGATAISYLVVIILLGAVIFLVIPPIVQQTAKFAQTVPTLVDHATTQVHALRDFIAKYNLQPQLDQAVKSINNTASSWAGSVGQNVLSGIGSVFSFFTAMILILVLTFLMLVEGPSWVRKFWSIYSNEPRMMKHKEVAGRMYGVFTGYVTGQLTVSAIDATTAGLMVFILSFIFPIIPASLAMPTAAIAFVLSLIPMFGATIGGIIITLLLAFNSVPAAIIYVIYFVVYQQIENNFIAPHIQSKKIDLSALAVLGSVTIGLYVFGIVGGIIAIPIAGVVKILIEEYIDARKSRHNDDEKTVKTVKLES
ncbi:AI-2E family transporter [Patescibacteria group bacterium]|nr:MAG: AI-2E family transporter [Patescibacteria group bacterium]